MAMHCLISHVTERALDTEELGSNDKSQGVRFAQSNRNSPALNMQNVASSTRTKTGQLPQQQPDW
jgi:hypothetical protein